MRTRRRQPSLKAFHALWQFRRRSVPYPGLPWQSFSWKCTPSKDHGSFEKMNCRTRGNDIIAFRALQQIVSILQTTAIETWHLCQVLLYLLFFKFLVCRHKNSQKKRQLHVSATTLKRSCKGKLNKKVMLYRKMPFRTMSRLWGKINSVDLPTWLRKPALSLYIWMFGCKLEEAAVEDLQHYKNLQEFFTRALKPYVRTVDNEHSVTSPADGRVIHFGEVKDGQLEQVKGVTYNLQGFLGQCTWTRDAVSSSENHSNEPAQTVSPFVQGGEFENSLKLQKDTNLYHCIIYLAPGDYHRFHSPANWMVQYRRHFLGELLSVNPGIARWVQGLFTLNERAVYYGYWKHGFFSMAAVGATNVGSIKVYFDSDLITNRGRIKEGIHYDKAFWADDRTGIEISKGELFGEFNLGSTIVLVFEAPKSFQFKVTDGQKIKFGEPVGCLES